MKVPIFNDVKLVDEDGKMTSEWRDILSQLFQSLQTDFSEEGIIIPSQPRSNISKLDDSPNWTMIGDQTEDLTDSVLKIKIDGVWKNINTTP